MIFNVCVCVCVGFSGEFYKVQLPSSLAAGAKLRVKVDMVFSHVLTPFPSHITQAERQLVVFQGNHYLFSPYPTRTQTTRVRLASKTVESYTKLGNPSKSDEVIEYGPFRDVAPFSEVMPSDPTLALGAISNPSVKFKILSSPNGGICCAVDGIQIQITHNHTHNKKH